MSSLEKCKQWDCHKNGAGINVYVCARACACVCVCERVSLIASIKEKAIFLSVTLLKSKDIIFFTNHQSSILKK
jgi:hypothetical protein